MKVSSATAYFVDDEYIYDDAGDAVDYTYNVLGQLIKAETTSSEWGQSEVSRFHGEEHLLRRHSGGDLRL